MRANEREAWTVAVGNPDPTNPASVAAVEIIKEQVGLLGVHPHYPRGTLLLFDTERHAREAKKVLESHGIQTGKNVCQCFIPKGV